MEEHSDVEMDYSEEYDGEEVDEDGKDTPQGEEGVFISVVDASGERLRLSIITFVISAFLCTLM